MTKKAEALARDSVGHLIGQTGKAVRRRMDHNLVEAGVDLNTPQMVLMEHIDMEEGVNQQTLTDHLCLDKTTVTRYIDVLEQKNLVTRVPDRSDRRQNMIYLTQPGKQLLGRLEKAVLKTQHEATQGIDTQELATFRKVLHQIRVNLGDPGNEAV